MLWTAHPFPFGFIFFKDSHAFELGTSKLYVKKLPNGCQKEIPYDSKPKIYAIAKVQRYFQDRIMVVG